MTPSFPPQAGIPGSADPSWLCGMQEPPADPTPPHNSSSRFYLYFLCLQALQTLPELPLGAPDLGALPRSCHLDLGGNEAEGTKGGQAPAPRSRGGKVHLSPTPAVRAPQTKAGSREGQVLLSLSALGEKNSPPLTKGEIQSTAVVSEQLRAAAVPRWV